MWQRSGQSLSTDILLSTMLGVSSSTTRAVLDTVLSYLHPHLSWYVFDTAVVCAAVWTLFRWLHKPHQQLRTTQLRGPPSESFLYGVGKRILKFDGSGATYETWAQEYGRVYTIPAILGIKGIVLCDPKAIAHFYAKDASTYMHTPFVRQAIPIFVRGRRS